MQISSSESAAGGGGGGGGGGGVAAPGSEPCRFPKLEECAHFHYERVQLPKLVVSLQSNTDKSLHSQHSNDDDDADWAALQVTSGDACWLLQRNNENFRMLDAQLHQCIYDRKISQLPTLADHLTDKMPLADIEATLHAYLDRLSDIADNSINCGPVLNWLQMDNKGHRLLVPSEESRSINTPAVAAAYSVRRYVSQARDELNLEVGDMISVIDMASPGESMWWRGKRGFQVGFFPQHCVHIIGDKVPRNMPLPAPVVGSLALSPIKPVLRKHGKLITFFRSFILNRPSRRRLKQTGILRERVFGCDLGEHLLNSGHEIPMVLKSCAEFIEKSGIVDGIYRLSGVTSNIQKLRNAFDEDRIPNLYTEDILQDIHSVASLLKMYFRELPNPLCTYQLYQSFVTAVQGCHSSLRNTESEHDRLLKMREAVQKLPPPHYRTLEYLMRHLAKVAKHGCSTGMTTRNIAIVWAPNLLRCAELEVGGVAALQGVGVQAVVTEFLICYAHLIFCDHLPIDFPTSAEQIALNTSTIGALQSPKRNNRPKSLAISTPTKLITLEEARNKHLLSKTDDYNYIEVGGGPKNLPKKYHTIIDLPGGGRKRANSKRSPLGWRSLFSKSRNNSQGVLVSADKPRKASTPGNVSNNENAVSEADLTEMKRKLRSVKSAESLTSGHSEPTSAEIDVLGPLYTLSKQTGHNRSVSHDSYFDTLAPTSPQNNSDASLLDLSEIQLNFELEESEMRIFSEDESLVSSPRPNARRILTRARPEEFSSATNSGNPSPKKQARVVLSPDSSSRKRTRLEDQLSDIQYIDCSTPENVIVATMAQVHAENDANETIHEPQKKSPRNSDHFDKRQSLNLDSETIDTKNRLLKKSLTDLDFDRDIDASSLVATPTPQSPDYRVLESISSTPDQEIYYENLKKSPNYENILTTISITYKSPPRSIDFSSPVKSIDSNYENVMVNVEKAVVPTSTASLPCQEAAQPPENERRPKSLSALDDVSTLKPINLSSNAVCDTSELISMVSLSEPFQDSSIHSSYGGGDGEISESIDDIDEKGEYRMIGENSERDLSLSEVIHSSTENLSDNLSLPSKTSERSPMISPNLDESNSELDKTDDLIEFSPNIEDNRSIDPSTSQNDEIYEQVKFYRRSIHEVNALLADDDDKPKVAEVTAAVHEDEIYDSLEPDQIVYENVENEVVPSIAEDARSGKVKDLATKFEIQTSKTKYIRKFYEKDSLPPCLRARNLKNQLKTRSLDEEEFAKEFGIENNRFVRQPRRSSMDEGLGYKTNSLPKRLNEPKMLPIHDDEVKLTKILHSAHSNENIEAVKDVEEQKKRERIEKYKEERRKVLHEKYRSESFKEDKDVLKSQLRVFKGRDETKMGANEPEPVVLSMRRRSSSKTEENCALVDSLEVEQKSTGPKMANDGSIKLRTAIFEQQTTIPRNQRADLVKIKTFGKLLMTDETKKVQSNENNDDFVQRRKDDLGGKYERRRHTYERERERECEVNRVSLDAKMKNNARLENSSPSYCIKDMKAIFESKSKQ